MRVIAGSARGVRLDAPKGMHARPTLDRVREALFSILMPRLEGARFLDLYSGSGANGIEALSRGASFAVFVDEHRESLMVIRGNLSRVKLEAGAYVARAAIPDGLQVVMRGMEPFDIVFADPPYKGTDYVRLLEALTTHRAISEAGIVVIEHDKQVELPEKCAGLSLKRTAYYGQTGLTFFA